MRLNFISVCTDAYPMQYARTIITRLKEVSNFEYDCYCITDRPDEIRDLAIAIPPLYKGWWNKPMVFAHGNNDFTLYMDIDIVIRSNFDEEIEYATKWPDHIVLVEDAIHWMQNDLSTSWMVFNSKNFTYISERLIRDHMIMDLNHFKGGDQVWLGKHVQPPYHLINKTYPDLKKNLKFDLGTKVFNMWDFPRNISNNIKLIDCGGKPKPHELEQLPYIKQNWHDVRT